MGTAQRSLSCGVMGAFTGRRARLLLLAAVLLRPCNFVSFQARWSRSAESSKLACKASFEENREALKECLAREYQSFFRPFEAEYYSEEVTFKDPLNSLKGKASYKANVEMLSGESLVG
ncbi:unnamed protein product, partial [Effrenium voratum]